MPMASARAGEIYFEQSGVGPPLMFISGLGGVGRFWSAQVAAFAPRFRVVLHDHRGTGRSSKSRIRYSIPQMAEDVLAVMDAAGVSCATMVGQSAGGAIGQYLAARHPERLERLVLSSTLACGDVYFRELFRLRQEILRTAGLAAYDRLTRLLCYPPWFVNLHPESLEGGPEDTPPEVILSRIDALLEFNSQPYAHEINTPTLILGADDDAVTPPHLSDDLHKLLPNARRERLKHGGHLCARTVPDEYNAALRRFLEAT